MPPAGISSANCFAKYWMPFVGSIRHPVLKVLRHWLDGRSRASLPSRVVIELNTLLTLYEHGYRLSVFCRPCGRHVFLDLPALIAAGEGARAVVGLRVRCRVCGGRGELSIIWDPSHRGVP
jgi:hypothetical protein